MALKSTKLIKLERKRKKGRSKPLNNVVLGGISVLVGLGLLSETSKIINQI